MYRLINRSKREAGNFLWYHDINTSYSHIGRYWWSAVLETDAAALKPYTSFHQLTKTDIFKFPRNFVFMVYLTKLPVVPIILPRNLEWSVNHKFERMGKVYLKVLSRHLSEYIDENQEKPRSKQPESGPRFEPGVSRTEVRSIKVWINMWHFRTGKSLNFISSHVSDYKRGLDH
jgi:hypothetical protein